MTLDTIRKSSAYDTFPHEALEGCDTALVMFAAAFHGEQDAVWIADQGLQATCVDIRPQKLGEMVLAYPEGWEYVYGDAFTYAARTLRTWDVVTVDCPSGAFDRCAAEVSRFCALANRTVILGCWPDARINVPHGWTQTGSLLRSGFRGGVAWAILERDEPNPSGNLTIRADMVTACLVTRGDIPMQPILESLIFEQVRVWDNSVRSDRKTAGRYYMAEEAQTDFVYFQDDDVLVPVETQHRLLESFEPGIPTAVYGHGATPDGYDDLPLVCGGAIMDRTQPTAALNRYLARHPADDGFHYEADFVAGVLYPSFKHVRLPFHIQMDVAQHESRLVNQPFQKKLKHEITERARKIRDKA